MHGWDIALYYVFLFTWLAFVIWFLNWLNCERLFCVIFFFFGLAASAIIASIAAFVLALPFVNTEKRPTWNETLITMVIPAIIGALAWTGFYIYEFFKETRGKIPDGPE